MQREKLEIYMSFLDVQGKLSWSVLQGLNYDSICLSYQSCIISLDLGTCLRLKFGLHVPLSL